MAAYHHSSKPPEPTAILFDLDDTLWPAAPLLARAEQIMMAWLSQHAPAVAALGLPQLHSMRVALIQQEPHYRVNLWDLRLRLLQDAFALAGVADPKGVQAQAAMQAFVTARNEVSLYADVHQALPQMAEKFLLGSISNGFANLQQIGLAQHFRISLAAHEFGAAKPDASIFHAACEALNVSPEQTVYVGDDLLLDVEGAQKAGLRAVWLRRDSSTPVPPQASHVRADAICSDLHQLQQWLYEDSRRPR